MRGVRDEALAAVKEGQLDEEAAAHDLTTELRDQLAESARRAAGGEQIVVDKHARPAMHGVAVQLQLTGPVLQQVFRADCS